MLYRNLLVQSSPFYKATCFETKSGFIRGVALVHVKSGLIRRVDFDGGGLIREGLLYLKKNIYLIFF